MKVFDDAYKSPLSIIVLDDIERMMEYVGIGPRFSNLVLQALLVLIKKVPSTAGRKLMVVATTTMPEVMSDMGLKACFNIALDVPLLESPAEIHGVLREACPEIAASDLDAISQSWTDPVPIKKLLNILEMARQDAPAVTYGRFMECAAQFDR